MQRRTVLTALGASVVPLTGCTGRNSPATASTATDTSLTDTPSTDTPTTDTKTPRPTPEHAHRTVSVSSVDVVPGNSPLDPSVEVTRSRVTADRTARLQVRLTNTATQPVWNTYVRIPAFSSFITRAGPQGQKLLLLQPSEQYATVSAECWRADLTEWQMNHAYTNTVTEIRYEAGDSRTTSFDIYGHPENTGPCLAPGDYRISNEYRIDDDDADGEAPRWGFTITVDDP